MSHSDKSKEETRNQTEMAIGNDYLWFETLLARVIEGQSMLKHYLLLHDVASGANFRQ